MDKARFEALCLTQARQLRRIVDAAKARDGAELESAVNSAFHNLLGIANAVDPGLSRQLGFNEFAAAWCAVPWGEVFNTPPEDRPPDPVPADVDEEVIEHE